MAARAKWMQMCMHSPLRTLPSDCRDSRACCCVRAHPNNSNSHTTQQGSQMKWASARARVVWSLPDFLLWAAGERCRPMAFCFVSMENGSWAVDEMVSLCGENSRSRSVIAAQSLIHFPRNTVSISNHNNILFTTLTYKDAVRPTAVFLFWRRQQLYGREKKCCWCAAVYSSSAWRISLKAVSPQRPAPIHLPHTAIN